VTLFTKDGDNPNNLFDMQCMWYEIEFGRSCLRTKAFGKVLSLSLSLSLSLLYFAATASSSDRDRNLSLSLLSLSLSSFASFFFC